MLMMSAFRKNNVPRTAPIYDPAIDPNCSIIQTFQHGEAYPSNVHDDSHEPQEQEYGEQEELRRRQRERWRRPRKNLVQEFQ